MIRYYRILFAMTIVGVALRPNAVRSYVEETGSSKCISTGNP
jgi:hypothetical protein